MNSILTYIAGLLVLLLFAALIGPSLVDWNQFRDEIEAQASEAAGRPVSIDGDIRFRILPEPHFTLGKIKIGHNPNADSLPSNLNFATFAEIDGEVALAPLLSGDIEITRVRIIEPEFNLEVLPDGSGNWRGLEIAARMPEEGMFSLASISLEKASFVDGTINYRNRLNDRSWKAEEVAGDVVATSLLGPLRSELKAKVEGVPVAIRLGLGSFGGQKAFRVTTEVDVQDRALTFLFSGVATEFSLAARLDGNARIEFSRDEEKDSGSAPIKANAGMVIDARQTTLRNLAIEMAGTTLGGTAEIRWDRTPVFSAALVSDSFTIDPLLDRLDASQEIEGVSLLDRLLTLPLPATLEGDAAVETAVLGMRGAIIRDAKLDLSLSGGVLTVAAASATLGGPTKINANGEFTAAEDGLRFDGMAKLESANLQGLKNWIADAEGAEREESSSATRSFPLSAQASLRLAPGEYDFSDIRAAYAHVLGQPQLQGNLTWQDSDSRSRIGANLDVADFSFDPLLALFPGGSDLLGFFDAHDIALEMTAEKFGLYGQIYGDVETDLLLEAGKLTVSRLEAGDAAGAQLSFAGELTGVTTGKRDDVRGTFTGTIKAQRFGGLLGVGGIEVPNVEGPVDVVVTGSSGEADDSMSRVDTLTLKGSVRGSRVDGVVKRMHEGNDGVDRLEIIGNAVNEEGRVLLEQLGLSPREGLEGSGMVSVQLSGTTGSYETNFRVNVNGTTLTARGNVDDPFEALKFEGRAEIAASGVIHALGAFGAPDALANWIGDQASGPGFVFSSAVVWDKDSLKLDGFESVAGSFRLSGDAQWHAGDGDKLPQLTGKFESNAVDLTSLVTVPDEGEGRWPARGLDWSPLAAFDADTELKTERLTLGPLGASDVTSHIAVSHGVLTASPFSGNFADGRLSAGVRVEGGSGEPGIGLTLLVEEASLGQAFSQAFGASPGSGRLAFNAQLQGQGRSWLALVSSVSGVGKFDVADATMRPFDLEAFGERLSGITSIEAFPSLVSGTLWQGETAASDVGGDFEMKDGVLRFEDDAIGLEGGAAKVTATYDLPRLASQAEMTVMPVQPEGAPAFDVVARGQAGSMKVETNMIALQDFVAKRILSRDLEETGADVPDELRDLMELPVSNGTSQPATPMPRPSAAN
ncbi:AsmA family protein [Parvibaculum sp.]|uniref:AsmA family protein n=1 Tax=Parvibaculum sp. TaxID=2024848 RepID=UPI003BAD259A